MVRCLFDFDKNRKIGKRCFGKSDKLSDRNAYTYEKYVMWMNSWLNDLDLKPADVEDEMKKWLWRFKDGGQFAKA